MRYILTRVSHRTAEDGCVIGRSINTDITDGDEIENVAAASTALSKHVPRVILPNPGESP